MWLLSFNCGWKLGWRVGMSVSRIGMYFHSNVSYQLLKYPDLGVSWGPCVSVVTVLRFIALCNVHYRSLTCRTPAAASRDEYLYVSCFQKAQYCMTLKIILHILWEELICFNNYSHLLNLLVVALLKTRLAQCLKIFMDRTQVVTIIGFKRNSFTSTFYLQQ